MLILRNDLDFATDDRRMEHRSGQALLAGRQTANVVDYAFVSRRLGSEPRAAPIAANACASVMWVDRR